MSDTAEDVLAPRGLRPLRGAIGLLERSLLLLAAILGLGWMLDAPTHAGIAFYPEQFIALYWAIMLALVFLSCPVAKSGPMDRVPWYDWLLFAAALANGVYVVGDYGRIVQEMAFVTWDKWLSGAVTLALLAEAARRITAPSLLWIMLAFLAYAVFAHWIPGMLRGNSTSIDRLLIYIAFDSNALLGQTLFIIATIVLAYLLFGQVLNFSGGTKFFTDLAVAAMGRYRGGPAKVSVVGSTFFGSISGGAVTSVVTVGVITIPMMIRYGFRREAAAAIEATASTGGQIMPPVMGVAAFMMAELLNIPYATIALAALLPALLFYFMLFVQVDVEASKYGLRGLPDSEIPRSRDVLRAGWPFLLPIAALLVVLFFFNLTAEKAAIAAVVTALVVSCFRRSTVPTPRRIAAITVETSRGMLELAVIGAIIAVMMGALNVSGLGVNIVNGLTFLGGESTLLMLTVAAILAFVLGLGLPTLAVYLLLAILLAPALVKAGLDPLAVHMFLFYQGMMSMLSPPVAVAAFIAANIAKANPMRTGWLSMRVGAIAMIMPFAFVYSPDLLLKGPWYGTLWVAAMTACGSVLFCAAAIGYFYRDLSAAWRLALLGAAACCFWPYRIPDGYGFAVNAAGLAVLLVLAARRTARAPNTLNP